MSLPVNCLECGQAYPSHRGAASNRFICRKCREAAEVSAASALEEALPAFADERWSVPPRQTSARHSLPSISGSLVLHAILFIVAMIWIVPTQTATPDSFVTITTTDSNLEPIEPLVEMQIPFDVPGETLQKLTHEQISATQLLDHEIPLPEVPPPILPAASSSIRNGQDDSPQQAEPPDQPIADRTKTAGSAMIEKEVQRRVERAGGKSGPIQVSLIWNNGNDLDLYVQTPVRDIIAFNYKRSRCGGELDVDMNARKPQSLRPVENVYWSTKQAPHGVFFVAVHEYQNHGYRDPTSFLVSLKVDGEVYHFRGIARSGRPVRGVCKFERSAEGVKFLETPRTMTGNTSGKAVRKQSRPGAHLPAMDMGDSTLESTRLYRPRFTKWRVQHQPG